MHQHIKFRETDYAPNAHFEQHALRTSFAPPNPARQASMLRVFEKRAD
jgi:hypothetical protein